jgi:DNA-binding GntR family transcriptional regulator
MKRSSKRRIPDEVVKEIFPKRLKRNLPSREAYDKLQQMILTGKLKKGERLIEQKIAQRFDVSRTSLRRAFSRLKKEGFITIRKEAGTLVK